MKSMKYRMRVAKRLNSARSTLIRLVNDAEKGRRPSETEINKVCAYLHKMNRYNYREDKRRVKKMLAAKGI